MKNIPTPHGNVTNKQMKFVKRVVATNFDPDKIEEAVVLAGYSQKNASMTAKRLFDHEGVRGCLLEAMTRVGLTIENLASVHFDALSAVHPKNTALPDHNVRLKAVQMGYDLLDVMPGKRVEVTGEQHITHTLNERTLLRAQAVTGEEVVDVDIVEEAALERPF